MNHLIDSYGLFLAFFVSMFVLMMVVDYLARKFNIGFLQPLCSSGQHCAMRKDQLFGADLIGRDEKSVEQLEKRLKALELEVNTLKDRS